MLIVKGAKGYRVRRIQEALGIKIDGDFGGNTEKAVIAFQQSHDLHVDGKVGDDTLKALGLTDADLVEPVDTSAIQQAASGTVLESIIALWPGNAEAERHIRAAASILAPYLERVHLSTRAQLALFAGQVRQEVGPDFDTAENLNYRCDVLPKLFSFYRNNLRLAMQHGRCNGHDASQTAIANHAYANRYGNRGPESGDGWLYSGGGCKQLTFHDNYMGYQAWLKELLPEVYVAHDGEQIMQRGRELVSQAPHSMLTAVFFWDVNKLWRHADEPVTEDKCNAVTAVVNKHTDSYKDRWQHTISAYKLLG